MTSLSKRSILLNLRIIALPNDTILEESIRVHEVFGISMLANRTRARKAISGIWRIVRWRLRPWSKWMRACLKKSEEASTWIVLQVVKSLTAGALSSSFPLGTAGA